MRALLAAALLLVGCASGGQRWAPAEILGTVVKEPFQREAFCAAGGPCFPEQWIVPVRDDLGRSHECSLDPFTWATYHAGDRVLLRGMRRGRQFKPVAIGLLRPGKPEPRIEGPET